MSVAKPANLEIARRFDEVADRFDEFSNSYTVSRRIDLLVSLAHGRCLEFGGGTGEFSARLTKPRQSLHSDISARMCAVARRKCGCSSICFDAESVPLAGECVDTAVGSEMLYYLDDPRRFLAEAHRVLRPDGRLLICATNPLATLLDRGRSFFRRLGFKGMFFDDGSPRFIPLSRLTQMLREAGFVIERAEHIVPLPFAFLDRLNRFLERSLLRRFGLFMVIVARKQSAAC